MGIVASVVWPPLSPETIVYRAYPFPDSFNKKTGKPEAKLFYRKPGETGLSVALSTAGILARYPSAAGMCQLVVGSITTLGIGVLGCPDQLSVIQDDTDHAQIYGVPTRNEDQEKALRIAKYLARIADDLPLPRQNEQRDAGTRI